MKLKRIFLITVVVALLVAVFSQLVTANSAHEKRNSNDELIIGEKAALVTMDSMYSKDKALLESLTTDDGNVLKNEWNETNEKKIALFNQYHALLKEMLQAKKSQNEDEWERLKEKQADFISMGEYRDMEFLRGTNWDMIFYESLPDFTSVSVPYDMIGIIDGEKRTVALLKVMYNSDNNTFDLVEAETTLEWLLPTDVYQSGSGEVGVTQTDEQQEGATNE